MKTNIKTFAGAFGLLALATSALISPALAAPYTQPYTASFGVGQTGQASSVVYYVFDAAGTLRVGPASYVNAAGATVAGPNNEPVVAESRDYTGTGGTGAYYAALPLDTAWGPLHIKVVITGQAGVAAEGSLVNRGSDVADGYTASLPGTLSGGISSLGTTLTTTGVKVGSYAAGQDPYAQLMAGAFLTIPGDHTTSGQPVTLTFKQMQAIVLAVPASDNSSTVPAPGSTAATSYYLAGQPAVSSNLVYIGTVTYNAAGIPVSRTVKIASPFPAVN